MAETTTKKPLLWLIFSPPTQALSRNWNLMDKELSVYLKDDLTFIQKQVADITDGLKIYPNH